MRFKCGTKIFTSNGMQVGTLDRIVIEPNTREITHLVVQKGSLFTRDKVIPMELFDATTEDHITLHEMIEDPGEFPDF